MGKKLTKVNSGGFEFEFSETDIRDITVLNINEDNYTVLNKKDRIIGSVKQKIGKSKNYKVGIGSEFFEVIIKTEIDQLVDSMGFGIPKSTKLNAIIAPMPGLVIGINVEKDQEVNAGHGILVLEAMKMENLIKIPHDAIIKDIKVKIGQAVEKGQTLIELS